MNKEEAKQYENNNPERVRIIKSAVKKAVSQYRKTFELLSKTQNMKKKIKVQTWKLQMMPRFIFVKRFWRIVIGFYVL